MIILYGRRRIGKTRLAAEFIRDKEGILYFTRDTVPQIRIRRLQEAVARFFDDALSCTPCLSPAPGAVPHQGLHLGLCSPVAGEILLDVVTRTPVPQV